MSHDESHMSRALELAARGQGRVEPNPMVGCVIVRDGAQVGEGWHQRYGEPHAEVEALDSAGGDAAGATLYVTLEPCCHVGKTGPCTDAVIRAGIGRVVIALADPFPAVSGDGIKRLRKAGIHVDVGVHEQAARQLNAPYLTLIQKQRPWIIAKWAMTLDGKIASHLGRSQWISNRESRRIVHQLRRRVDAVMIGSTTARRDDPLLTARPPGQRAVARIVVDSCASLSPDSRLVRSCAHAPLLVAVGSDADHDQVRRLSTAGCDILVCTGATHADRLKQLFRQLGERRMTNVLVEGGGQLLGNVFDLRLIDEVHVFVAPKLVGGRQAPSPIAGMGLESISSASIHGPHIEVLDGDVYITGRVVLGDKARGA